MYIKLIIDDDTYCSYIIPERVLAESSVLRNMVNDLKYNEALNENEEIYIELPDYISLDGFEEIIDPSKWNNITTLDTLVAAHWLDICIDIEIKYANRTIVLNKPTQIIDLGDDYKYVLECWLPSMNYDKNNRNILIRAIPKDNPAELDSNKFKHMTDEIKILGEYSDYPSYAWLGFDVKSFLDLNKDLNPKLTDFSSILKTKYGYPFINIKPKFIIGMDPDYRKIDIDMLKRLASSDNNLLTLIDSYTFVQWAQKLCDINFKSLMEWSMIARLTSNNDYSFERLILMMKFSYLIMRSDKYEFKKILKTSDPTNLDLYTYDRYKEYEV